MKLSSSTFQIVAVAALAVVPIFSFGVVAEAGTNPATPSVATPAQVRYVCPMGCFEGDRPGRCPKCGMKLVEKKVVAAPAPPDSATGSRTAGHRCDHAKGAADHKCDHAKEAADHKSDHAKGAADHKCDNAKGVATTNATTVARWKVPEGRSAPTIRPGAPAPGRTANRVGRHPC